MGVIFASPGKNDRIVGATLNYEIDDLDEDAEEGDEAEEESTTDESTVQDQVSSDTDRNDEGA
jgi:DNA gyrase subunit A